MIFFKPEFRNQQGEIVNVVNAKGRAIGYIAYLYKEDKELYIMGQLNEEGEKQNFIDMTASFIDGLKKAILGDGEKEPNIYIHLGGQLLQLDNEDNGEEK
ncbi:MULTISPECIES: hypothetical protein [Aneurinibacillus]|uniref:Uncharacterized protein n=1 Tax=Aneurinibacillus thermoaerophilus TaxID=143495 RepID=A0A1G7Y089_ANETH|nr:MULTISPECIES: hypothetical protein [Aneurinibacillus]AMA72982.1 hypothetical protein ACH33_09005 [Aneurinibacillus sp. XH2]MED0675929.1 hypothetical protein [Aneurinibacillus thermoaerophilus]MED0677796.1 hypothetical protein [Aneurinibacillus thermoaerophilus]MED0737545.1 hypothetical protein [Aneurinibacillus thermoaerophilus]MED0758116.1 hypothetical protein [Aneurinibacillus thermoaerophilus]